ncbi:MAG: NHL repeat-containing protein [Candidatus Coatesbacteria bacterium]|nr:MAG: NHL repeat-containing protein [Candidatus Coatesbacteria bacterium]
MRKYFLLIAAAAVALALAACDSDTEGNGPPITGMRIWVADQPDKEVEIYDMAGARLKHVGGPPMFSKPNAIGIYLANGDTWVCDFYTNRIRKFNANGDPIFATPGSEQGFLVLNPAALAVGQASGECWVSDRGNNRVLRLGPDGSVLARVTGFQYPRGLAVGPTAGDVWVADEGNDAVVKIASTARGTVAVRNVEVGRYTGMENPWAVAAEANGRAWVSSRLEGRVVKLSSDAAEVAAVGGFDEPVAVAVDDTAGSVYVVDTASGVLVALPRALTGTHGNYRAVAKFVVPGLARPEDVFADEKNGRVYVAEMGGGNVRIYDTSGQLVQTLGGFAGPAVVAAWDED